MLCPCPGGVLLRSKRNGCFLYRHRDGITSEASKRGKMSVRSWPTYLLRDIPEETRTALEADALTEEKSLAECIREALCSHYELDCEPVEAIGRPPAPKKGVTTMVLRLQPALWEAIKADAGWADTHYGSPRGAIDRIIHGILSSHYNGGHPQ